MNDGTKGEALMNNRGLRIITLIVFFALVFLLNACTDEITPVEQPEGTEKPQAVVLSSSYSTTEDWTEGTIVKLDYETVPDQLQLPEGGSVESFPEMWIANAGEDSLSKWNTETNRELARYHTWFGPLGNHSAWGGAAPSRTAVDFSGNCFVANRHFDGRPADVIKILREDWIDRNGNGILDTSWDANDDGTISPSEMLPMSDLNGNGQIDDNEIVDERVAWVVSVGASGGLGRSLAVDLEGNVWLGLYSSQVYYKLGGEDGSVLEGPINVSPNTPYGALVDSDGILWGSSLGTNLLRLDTNTLDVNVLYHSGSDYGIALAFDDDGCTRVIKANRSNRVYTEYNACTGVFSTPAALSYSPLGIATDLGGNVLAPNASTGALAKFDPDGNVLWSVPAQVSSEPRGCVVDSNEDVWVIHRAAERLSKFDGSDGSPLGVFVTGRQPYTYSDATGLGLFNAVGNRGYWTTVYDVGVATAIWGVATWNSSEPENTSVTVKVRSSRGGGNWSAWETAMNGVRFSSIPNGRYLEIQATLQRTQSGVTPILYDLSVQTLPLPVK